MSTFTAIEISDGMFEFFADGQPMNKCACLADLMAEKAEFQALLSLETGEAAEHLQEMIDALDAQIGAIPQ